MKQASIHTKPRKRSRFKRFFLLLRLTGIALFIVIMTRVDPGDLWQKMKMIPVSMLLLAILFQLMVLLLKGIRWQLLNYNESWRKGWLRSFGEFYESYAIGVITPGRMGELLKAGHAGQRTGIVGSGIRVLVERGLDLGFFLVVAGGSMLFAGLVDILALWGWLVLITGIAGLIIATLLLVSRKVLGVTNSVLLRIKLLKEPVPYRKRGPGEKAFIVILAMLSNFSYFISCYFLGIGVGIENAFLYLSGGVAIAGLLNMLPITVMGLGTRELTFVYVFGEYLKTSVLAFSGLVFLVAQAGGGLFSLLLGEVFLWINKSKRKDG
jgi:uncharacterized protein (TIRG00374 family)